MSYSPRYMKTLRNFAIRHGWYVRWCVRSERFLVCAKDHPDARPDINAVVDIKAGRRTVHSTNAKHERERVIELGKSWWAAVRDVWF